MRNIWARWVRSIVTNTNPRARVKGQRRPRLERLEERLAPATFVWSGAGDGLNWANGPNWVGGTAPTGNNDDLVFPNAAVPHNTFNDIPVGAAFKSITVSGDNSIPGYVPYVFRGNEIRLNSAIIVNTGATGIDFQMPIRLTGTSSDRRFFTAQFGAEMIVSGLLLSDLTSPAEMVKDGVGRLVLTRDNTGFKSQITLQPTGGTLVIRNAKALGEVTAGTVVGQNSQLQIDNGAGGITSSILEPITLNGFGITNDGALFNAAGTSTWAGPIVLDSDAAIGAFGTAAAQTTLTVTAVISDLGAGHNIEKVGKGRVIFTSANTYRGRTTVQDGTLTIQNALSLGPALGTPESGTLVNYNPVAGTAGTLQLDGVGTVLAEILTLNGPGFNDVGALHNLSGNNQWAGGGVSTVLLGSQAPNGAAVNIGAAAGTSLLVSGIVSDPNGVSTRTDGDEDPPGLFLIPYSLFKVGAGKLIFSNANTYAGNTKVSAGVLNIRDSLALGTSNITNVATGAALELEVETDPATRFDPYGRDLWNDSVTGLNGNGPQSGLRVTETLYLNGRGIGNTGALHSLSGINQWMSTINLRMPNRNTTDTGIGVDADPNASNTNIYFTNDYSLTLFGDLAGPNVTTFHKEAPGHLILPNRANSYISPTIVEQGWITVQHRESLGGFIAGRGDTAQPPTTVRAGAAVHLKPPQSGQSLQLVENFTFSGPGITHPFGLIGQKGALVSLGGINTIGGPVDLGARGIRTSDVKLQGTAGIGVEALDAEVQTVTVSGSPTGTFTLTFNGQTTAPLAATATAVQVQNALNNLSSIGPLGANVVVTKAGNVYTVTFGGYFNGVAVGQMTAAGAGGTVADVATTWDATTASTSELTISASIFDAAAGANGGITKFGSKRLNLQGDGSYSGPVSINEGVLRSQHDSALGLASSGTTTTPPTNGQQTYTTTTTTVNAGATELQTVAIRGNPGTYTLTFNGATTGPISTSATQGQVQAALDALPTIGAGGVSVTLAGNVYAIAFNGAAFAGTNQSQLIATPGAGVIVAVNTLRDGDGAALELGAGNPLNNGGISAGLSIWNERLVLSGLGNAAYDLSPLTVLGNDHLWHGPVTLATSAAIAVRPDARVIVDGVVDSGTLPANLIVTGGIGASEVQTVTVTGSGTFSLSFKGETTDAIPVGSHPALVQSALNALSTIGGAGGFVTVTLVGNVYTVTFGGSLKGSNLPQLGATVAGSAVAVINTTTQGSGGIGGKVALAGSNTFLGSTIVQQGALVVMNALALGTTGVSEVQTITVTGTGTFRLSFNGQSTGPLDAGSATLAADVQAALNTLTSIAGVGGVVSVTNVANVYTVVFGGNLLGFNQPLMTATATGPSVVIGTLQDGSGGTVVADGASLDTQGNLTVSGEPLILQGQGDRAAAAGAAIAEVQRVTITGAPTGTFTLFFNGLPTSPLSANSPTLASDIQMALNTLATIGAIGGSVTVGQSGNAYTITFGGNLRGFNQPLLTATAGGGTSASVATVTDGASASPNWFHVGPAPINNGQTAGNTAVTGRVTSVVVDPSDANVIYIATGGGGSWKTEDGGRNWAQLFDSNPVHRLYVPGTTGTFTLTFNGATTGPLNLASATLQQDIEDALNALPTIGGLAPVAGSVKVTQPRLNNVVVNPLVFNVTYGGALSGTTPPLLVAVGTGGTSNPVVTGTTATMVVGAIALDPNDPRIVYVGTGESNNATDSYYGTGVYKSLDSGKSWTLLTNSDGSNPVDGLAVTKIVVDYGTPQALEKTPPQPGWTANQSINTPTGRIYVATSNTFLRTVVQGGLQSFLVTFPSSGYLLPPTVTLIGGGGFGATASAILGGPNFDMVVAVVVTNPGFGYTTAPIVLIDPPPTGGAPAQAIASIQAPPRAGVYRFDESTAQVQTLTVPALSGTGTFQLSFNGATTADLSLNGLTASTIQTALNGLSTVQGPLANGANGWVNVYQSTVNPLVFSVVFTGGFVPRAVPNPPFTATTVPLMVASGGNGAADPAVSRASTWVNLTQTATTQRLSANANAPGTPGPNDDWRVSFPQTNVAWTDLALVYIDDSAPVTAPPGSRAMVPVLYAALGNGQGHVANAVYRTENPRQAPESAAATNWYIGDPGATVQNERQSITVSPTNMGGSFTLTLAGRTTPSLPANATAAQVQAALNALLSVNAVGGWVTVTLDPSSTATSNVFIVNFNGSFGAMQIGLITATVVAPVAVTIAEQQAGWGTDSRSNEFPLGDFATGIPRNGTIHFTTWVTPNPNPAPPPQFLSPVFANVTIYASIAIPEDTFHYPTTHGQFREIQKSTLGGKNWAATGALPNYMSNQGHYSSAILALGQNTVVVGGHESSSATHAQQVFISTDGGATWTDRSLSPGASPFGPHPSIHALAANAANNRVYVGSDGGMFQLDPATNTWDNLNGNLAITQFNSVAGHPTNLNVAYGGSRFNGAEVYNNDLAWRLTDGNDSGLIRVDPKTPSVVYHVENTSVLHPRTDPQGAALRKSTDGGQTWSTILTVPGHMFDSRTRYFPFVLDGVNTSRLLVGGYYDPIDPPDQIDIPSGQGLTLRESIDAGATWRSLSSPLDYVTAIGISTFQGTFAPDTGFNLVGDRGSNTYDPDTIYIYGIWRNPFTGLLSQPRLYVTKNHGLTWLRRDAGLPGDNTIADIVVDPTNRDTAYAIRNLSDASGRKVFKTTNAGQSWVDITNNLPDRPVWKLVIDPRYGDVYVGTDNGVWQLPEGSAVWNRFGVGLANVQVRDLDLNQINGTLLAGSYGRSMYQLFLDDARPNAGALRAVSGTANWAGTVQLVGDPVNNLVSVGANGTPALLNGITTAQLNILGTITDQRPTPGADPRLLKVGFGDVFFSGDNIYGGVTQVKEGSLVVRHPHALGSPLANTIVDPGTSLRLENDLELEPVFLQGDGVQPPFNGHNTGALRNTSSPNTYTGQLTLGSNVTIGVDSGSTLTIGSKAGLLGTGTITDGPNTFGFIKELAGTLVLASANTYDGATTVNQGAVQVQNAQALGSTAAGTEVRDGGQLQVQSPAGGPPVAVPGEALLLSGTGINNTGALLNTGGNNAWQGPITLTSGPGFSFATFPAGAVSVGVSSASDTLTLTGAIGEALASGLTKVGPGTLVLDQDNTYTGTTYVNAGVVRARKPNALGTANTNEVQRVTVTEFPGGQFALTYKGQTTAALAFNASAVDVRNALTDLPNIGFVDVAVSKTTVTAGLPGSLSTFHVFTIAFQGALAGKDQPLLTALGFNGSTAVATTVADGQTGTVVRSAAALELEGSIGVPESIGLNGTGVDGTGALRNVGDNNTLLGALVLMTNASVGVNAGTSLTAVGDVQDYDPVDDAVPVSVPAAGLTKVLDGALAFPNANSYSGKTTVAAGVLNIRNNGALGTSAPEQQTVTVLGAGGTFTLRFDGFTTPALDLLSPTLAADIQNELNQLQSIGGVGGTVTVTQGTGSASNVYTVTFGGSLTLDNLPSLISSPGAGVMALVATLRDGPEGTVVNAGATLQVQNLNSPMTREALTLNGPGFNDAGALENLAGNNTWNRTITLGSDSSVGVTGAADTLAINQPITDGASTFGVTKVGPGTLAYTGTTSNDYHGLTQVNQGTLALNKSAPAQAIVGNLTVGDGKPAAGTDATVINLRPDQIADAALVTVQGDGLYNLDGQLETFATLRILDGLARTGTGGVLQGALDMTGGRLTIGSGGQMILTGNLTATSSATQEAVIEGPGGIALNSATPRGFTVNDGPLPTDLHLTANSQVTGSNGLTKLGAGRMELDGTYAGASTISAGDLQVDGTAGNVTLTGGTLSGTGTAGAVTTGSPGTVAPGANGTATPTGILTTGNVVWNAETNFQIQVNTPTPGTGHDQLVVNGSINLNGANLLATFGPLVDIGQEFTIITATGGVTGQFVQGTTFFAASKKYTIVYNQNSVVIRPERTTVSIDLSTNANPSDFGQNVVFTATLTAEAGSGPLPEGQVVTFTIDRGLPSQQVFPNVLVGANGQAILMLNTLSVGTHTVEVDYAGTSIYEPASQTLTPAQAVNQASTTIDLTVVPQNSVYSQGVTLTANVVVIPPGAILPNVAEPTGLVTFQITNLSTGVPLQDRTVNLTLASHGVASVFLDDLPVAVYSVRVTYAGDTSFTNSATFSDQQFIIDKAPSLVTVTGQPPTIGSGEEVVFTATVTANPANGGVATGQARFFDGPADTGVLLGEVALVNGVATLATTALTTAGDHTITVVYSGDSNFFPSTGTVQQAVRGNTVTTVTSPFSPSGLGQTVTFTATVRPTTPGAPTPSSGVVTFFVDGVERGTGNVDANGQAVFNTSTLTLGLHQITARFEGSTIYNASPTSGPLSHRVVAFTTALSLVKAPATTVYGQGVGVSATVTSPGRVPTGLVQFFVDGLAFGAPVAINGVGKASVLIRAMPAGDHVVTARYLGTGTFGAARADVAHAVNKSDTTATVLSMANPAQFGQSVTFRATIAARAPGGFVPPGQVTFVIDGVAQPPVSMNARGVAVLTRNNLSVGTHTAVVSYAGSANYNGSDSAVLTQVVNPAPAPNRLAAAVTPAPVVVGNPFAITVFAKDVFNNISTTYNEPVSIQLVSGPVGGQVTGNLNLTFTAGVATFTNLFVNVGGRYRVRITSVLPTGLVLTSILEFVTIGRQT